MTEDKMVEWPSPTHEFEQVLGDSEGEGSRVCCSSWAHKESDTTEQLNNKINSCANFGNWYLSNNLPISFKLSGLLACQSIILSFYSINICRV